MQWPFWVRKLQPEDKKSGEYLMAEAETDTYHMVRC